MKSKSEMQSSTDLNVSNSVTKQKQFKKYKLLLFFSLLIACILIVLFFLRIIRIKENERTSRQLTSTYHVSTLYSDTYTLLNKNSLKNFEKSIQVPFVIGMIRIDKIGLNYPILSESNKQLLDISLCRFAGPMPNNTGNLCIAGHNYVDYKFFSRLHELERGDKIEIYDLNGKMLEYSVYDKYEASSDDTSCTKQDTNGNTIVTLLTCNNISGNRLIVVAKEI